MQIVINGQQQDLNVKTVADILAALGYKGDYFAVALNRTVVSRGKYAATVVNQNDELEILTPMQGG